MKLCIVESRAWRQARKSYFIYRVFMCAIQGRNCIAPFSIFLMSVKRSMSTWLGGTTPLRMGGCELQCPKQPIGLDCFTACILHFTTGCNLHLYQLERNTSRVLWSTVLARLCSTLLHYKNSNSLHPINQHLSLPPHKPSLSHRHKNVGEDNVLSTIFYRPSYF